MVHHLNKMIKRGSAMHHEAQRKLGERVLVDTVEEIRRDLGRIFEDVRKVAESGDQTADLSLR